MVLLSFYLSPWGDFARLCAMRSSLVRMAAAFAALALVCACQTTAGGPPRDEYVSMPKDLLRLQVDDKFYGGEIDALGSDAEVAWSTSKGSQGYHERITFSGPQYIMSLNLRMLPDGWAWTVPESVIGLQDDLVYLYGWTLGKDIQLNAITPVRTGFPRSFYARFSSKGRDCVGVMIASNVAVVSNNFRNTVVGYLCASAGTASTLRGATIDAMMHAITIQDPYYNGEGFSDEQIRYFKGRQQGVVMNRNDRLNTPS